MPQSFPSNYIPTCNRKWIISVGKHATLFPLTFPLVVGLVGTGMVYSVAVRLLFTRATKVCRLP